MSLLVTEAIVLGSQRLGEADKLVTLLTAERGKVRAVAKGVRKIKSRFGASLEAFTHSALVLFERRPGDLMRLNQASILHSFPELRRDLGRITGAGRAARMAGLLSPDGEANPRIFELLLRLYLEIERGHQDLELTLRFFEIHLLKYAGYLPKIDHCLKCGRLFSPGTVYFSASAGGALCESCHRRDPAQSDPVSKGTLAFLGQTARMGWNKLDRLRAGKPIRVELRELLNTSFSHITGRPFVHAQYGPET